MTTSKGAGQAKTGQGTKGVSSVPEARASAARQRAPRSTATSAPDRSGPPSSTPSTLVRTVRVGLVKPLPPETWETVGPRLRDVKGTMHRLLNAGVRASAIDGGGPAATSAASRKAIKAALTGERAYWTERTGKAFEGKNHDPEKATRMAGFALPSVIEDTVATRASKAFQDARKHMLRGDKSLPSFNRHAPIFFRDGSSSWELRLGEGGGYEVGFKLHPGRGPKTWFVASVSGAGAFADLHRMLLLEDGTKLCDAKIVKNDKIRVGPRGERRPMWEARLCYMSQAPSKAIGDALVAVHRGMHNMLTLVSTSGASIHLPGDAYLHAKLAFAARRRSLMKHSRAGELGKGARGHGVARRYKAMDSLGDREARMIQSACQQAAAAVMKFSIRERAGTVVLEDYQTLVLEEDDASARFLPKWPWAQFKGAVDWAAKKAGREVLIAKAAYISQKCPACGCTDEANVRMPTKLSEADKLEDPGKVQREGRHGLSQYRSHEPAVFGCVQCGLRRESDRVAAWNMLMSIDMPEGPRAAFQKALESFARQSNEARHDIPTRPAKLRPEAPSEQPSA
jgi:hypothetical protein